MSTYPSSINFFFFLDLQKVREETVYYSLVGHYMNSFIIDSPESTSTSTDVLWNRGFTSSRPEMKVVVT